MDTLVTRIPGSPYWLSEPADGTIAETIDGAGLLECIRRYSAKRALRPDYDANSFQWLFQQAGRQRLHGGLQCEVVRDSAGETLGWYAYYVKPGGIAQVLQIGGRSRRAGCVLDHLFYNARHKGAVAISGQFDPAFAKLLARNQCSFTWSGSVLIHSRNERLLNAIHRGDAFLTRFEGEWWMRFCDLSHEVATT
jgi:hypothetical protein